MNKIKNWINKWAWFTKNILLSSVATFWLIVNLDSSNAIAKGVQNNKISHHENFDGKLTRSDKKTIIKGIKFMENYKEYVISDKNGIKTKIKKYTNDGNSLISLMEESKEWRKEIAFSYDDNEGNIKNISLCRNDFADGDVDINAVNFLKLLDNLSKKEILYENIIWWLIYMKYYDSHNASDDKWTIISKTYDNGRYIVSYEEALANPGKKISFVYDMNKITNTVTNFSLYRDDFGGEKKETFKNQLRILRR